MMPDNTPTASPVPKPPPAKRLPPNPVPPRSANPRQPKAVIILDGKIGITHLRVMSGKNPEAAAMDVRGDCVEALKKLTELGLRVEVEQMKPNPDNGSPVTAGVDGKHQTEISVRLVHATKGSYLTRVCENTAGTKGPRTAVESLILNFNRPAFDRWLNPGK